MSKSPRPIFQFFTIDTTPTFFNDIIFYMYSLTTYSTIFNFYYRCNPNFLQCYYFLYIVLPHIQEFSMLLVFICIVTTYIQ